MLNTIRNIARLIQLAWLMILGMLLGCETERSAPRGVILIVVDTLRADAVGCYGGPEGITPQIDRWAAEGLRFDQAVAHSPWTLPSTASILTGLFPAKHGAGGNLAGDFWGLDPGTTTLAERLFAAQVRTQAVTNGAFLTPVFGLERGFENWDHDPGSNSQIRRSEDTIRAAIQWLATLGQDETFFLYLHLFDPHMNYDPPRSTRGRRTGDYHGALSAPFGELLAIRDGDLKIDAPGRDWVRGIYHEEVEAVDLTLAVLADWLQNTGLERETLLILTADHGEEFWEHDEFEHGHSFYEELVRIPLILRPPGGLAAGQMVPAQVTQADLAPTILRAFGVPGAAELDGQSLLDEDLRARPLPAPTPAPLAGLLYSPQGDGGALRADQWKAVFWESGERLLFDLQQDPGEEVNLAEQQPDRLAEMDSLWRALAPHSRGQSIQLDEEARDRLRALGYLN